MSNFSGSKATEALIRLRILLGPKRGCGLPAGSVAIGLFVAAFLHLTTHIQTNSTNITTNEEDYTKSTTIPSTPPDVVAVTKTSSGRVEDAVELGENEVDLGKNKEWLLHKGGLSFGFPDRENAFPFLLEDPDEISSMIVGRGQPVKSFRLERSCMKYPNGSGVDLHDFDAFFGVGWFFDHQMKMNRKRIQKTLTAYPPSHIRNKWIDGVRWADGTRRYPRNKSDPEYIPYLIGYSGEAFTGGSCDGIDVIIDSGGAYDKGKKHFFGCAVIFSLSALRTFMHRNEDEMAPQHLVLQHPPPIPTDLRTRKFAGFLAKNCYHTVYTAQVAVRPEFFDLLSEYKPVMAIKNNAGTGCRVKEDSDLVIRNNETLSTWDAAVQTYKRYKFVITFENRQLKGYLTEKIMNALLAGVIPIYFGAPDVAKYLNPKRFVFCDVDAAEVLDYRFPDGKQAAENNPEPLINFVKDTIGDKLRECVDRVREIDQNDDLYYQMISEPILPDNRLEGSEFDVNVVMQRIRRALMGHQEGDFS